MSRTRRWVDPVYIKNKRRLDNISEGYTKSLDSDIWGLYYKTWLDKKLRGPETRHNTCTYWNRHSNRQLKQQYKRETAAALREYYNGIQLDAEDLAELEAREEEYYNSEWGNTLDHLMDIDDDEDWYRDRDQLQDLDDQFHNDMFEDYLRFDYPYR
jgi:hypothetical protein